jgi:hypothetical protein
VIPLQDIPISVAKRVIEDKTSQEIAFLENGPLDAVGYGRSLMPDDEHHRRDHEIDVGVGRRPIFTWGKLLGLEGKK